MCNTTRHKLFEKSVSICGDFIFYFGSEPFNMNHKHAHGILVSYWAKDPKVTKLRLSYNFAVSCLGVFGLGYGSRATVPSIGMNVYNKFYGKGTGFSRPNPTQAFNELHRQQYFRDEFKHQLFHPVVCKMINKLSI